MNENVIRKAREDGTLISSYTDVTQLENVIRWQVADALRLRGQSADENTMQIICKKTAEVLMRDYPNFTDKEFELILESGISGKLGRETWVSGASILQWMATYQNNAVRIQVAEEENEISKPNSKLTKEEIDRKNEIAFQEGYYKGATCYQQNGTIFHKDGFAIPQWPSIIYEEYLKRGVIPQPTKEQMEYAEKMAGLHDRMHPLKFKISSEGMQVHKSDLINAYLLEAHYKQEIIKSMIK